jgi:hypothetical protein
MTCEKCGQEMAIGGWPWCPHEPGATGAIDDSFIGGRTYENLGHSEVTVYSRSELRRELKARGLEEYVRHVPVPGTDKSPHTTSWTGVNLEAGKALAERQAHTRYRETKERHDPAIIAEVKRAFEEAAARS